MKTRKIANFSQIFLHVRPRERGEKRESVKMTKAIITSPQCRLILEDKFDMAVVELLPHILVQHQLLRTSKI